MQQPMLVPADFSVEFAGPEWFDLFQKACIAAARMGVLPDGVTCEVYLDTPAHLSSDRSLAWTRRVVRGTCTLEFVECADEEADTKFRADYFALLPLARIIVDEDERGFMSMVTEAVRAGQMEIVRYDPAASSNRLIHNVMAALTR